MEKLLIHHDPQKHESFYVDRWFYDLMSCRKKARESKRQPTISDLPMILASDLDDFKKALEDPSCRHQMMEERQASVKKCWFCQYNKTCSAFLSSLFILRTLRGLE